MDFGQRAVPLERGVQNVECSVAPAAKRRAAGQRIATFPDNAPYRRIDCLAAERVDGVQQLQVAGFARRLEHLGISAGVQRLDDCENLFSPASVNEVDRSRIVEHWLLSVQPQPRFVGRVEVR